MQKQELDQQVSSLKHEMEALQAKTEDMLWDEDLDAFMADFDACVSNINPSAPKRKKKRAASELSEDDDDDDGCQDEGNDDDCQDKGDDNDGDFRLSSSSSSSQKGLAAPSKPKKRQRPPEK